MAKTPQAGIGRQRFDFTSATGTIEGFMASASDGGGGMDMAGVGDEQLVRVVDDQFTLLIESIAGINVAASFSLVDTQFQALIAALGGVVTTTNAGQTPTPVPGATSLVQLVDTQYNGILAALSNIGVINPPSPIPTPTGGAGVPPVVNPPVPTLNQIMLVQLVDEQLQKILAMGGGASKTPVPVVNPPKPKWYDNTDFGSRLSKFASKNGYSRARVNQVNRIGDRVRGLGRAMTGTKAGGTLGAIGGGISKAAGPIGLGLAVADAAAATFAKTIQMASQGVKLFGDMAVKAVGNDGIGMLTSGLNAASAALGKIPVVGQVFSAGLELASAGLNTFQSVLNAVTQRGRELAKYSPELSMAAAQADVRKIFADIREARANERKYADLILKQQNIEESFQKALQPLKEVVADVLIQIAPLVQNMAQNLGQMLAFFVGNGKMDLSTLLKGYSDEQLAMAQQLNQKNEDALKQIQRELARRHEAELIGKDFLQQLGNMADSIPLENFVDPVDNRNAPNFKFPMVR
jgi:hypothetical protein